MQKNIHLRIGSSPKNEIVVQNSSVDSFHLELFSDTEGNVFITDLNSKSGTFINGKRLKGYTLLDSGDDVVLGDSYRLKWEQYKIVVPKKVISTEKKTTYELNHSSYNRQVIFLLYAEKSYYNGAMECGDDF
jgi:pSer/pThr/pTyr-binding forkhead associated (FHA) protein